MRNGLVDVVVSVSELKNGSSDVFRLAAGTPLNYSGLMGYKDPAEAYEAMIEFLDDLELAQVAKARLDAGEKTVRVSLDDLIGQADITIRCRVHC